MATWLVLVGLTIGSLALTGEPLICHLKVNAPLDAANVVSNLEEELFNRGAILTRLGWLGMVLICDSPARS